jgi:hypothetical protein
VSSDAFADMARSLDDFCQALRSALTEHRGPRPGSPASRESRGEPLAGEWGAIPSGDAATSVLLLTAACLDHLLAASAIMNARRSSMALYTVIRGSAEAASAAFYLLDPGTDARERVRRSMNWRLAGLSEDMNLMRGLAGPEAQASLQHSNQRVDAIARTARQFGFQFHAADRHRPARLGDKTPSATQLIDACASRTPGLGTVQQRVMSGVAHGQVHALMRFMRPSSMLTADGRAMVQLNLTASQAALDLMAGPFCASSLAERLYPFMGWAITEIEASVTRMLHAWGRIAGTPYPGPERQ